MEFAILVAPFPQPSWNLSRLCDTEWDVGSGMSIWEVEHSEQKTRSARGVCCQRVIEYEDIGWSGGARKGCGNCKKTAENGQEATLMRLGMGCWRHLPGIWQSSVSIREGMNLEDKEDSLGDGQSSREFQGLGRIGFLFRCQLSERPPLTLDVQPHSISPLENPHRLPSQWCISPGCTFIVYLLIY